MLLQIIGVKILFLFTNTRLVIPEALRSQRDDGLERVLSRP